jgi:AcrR family transcriptional regulator
VDNIRDRILETALAHFEARGYAGVSLRDIADELRLTKAALYYHFPSKQGIVEALVEATTQQRNAAIEQIDSVSTKAEVLDTLRKYIRIYVDHQRVMTWLTNDMTVPIDRTRHAAARRILRDLLVRSAGGRRDREKVFRANSAVLLLHAPVWSRYVSGDDERLLGLVCEIVGLPYRGPQAQVEAAPAQSAPAIKLNAPAYRRSSAAKRSAI